MRERGAHAQDQDGEAGHGGSDGPRWVGRPGLGEQVVGNLPAMPSTSEPIADHSAKRRAAWLTQALADSQARRA
ncbi:MAG TPA: hypothetical protein VN961_02970 [Streptosporangiaceae bacterium]|nr:hypothetical protein [Streptosporangiaceae bacterium]